MVEALADLPDVMREVVVLKHCQGWTLPQIAERIGRRSRRSRRCCVGDWKSCGID